ncbi:Tetratricopeptide repeat-like superfamily protein, putative [Theobroma cacao]|uniref:Tetratricopeptide repeat-like superfamily protein, putative n=1 Tax=Theobroma cacao TaxID=3641 RepID=A0A061FM41_THECC|nr:Tetratricopeptide repeat-like superfamily protein, putative [Theobroma cacao]
MPLFLQLSYQLSVTVTMSILRKLHNKSPYSQSILKILPASFFFTGQIPDPGPVPDEPFPDEPTSAYYDEQVYKAGRSGDLVTVGHLLNKRVRDGCFNTTKTFKFLTATESSFSILDDLVRTVSRLDKGVPRKNAFDSLISRLCKLGKTDESLRVIDTMAKEGYGLNAVSFYPILCVLTKKKKMEEAWRVVDLMRDAGLLPDVTTYNYLLTAYCFEGKLAEATAVVKKMEEEGLGADGRTFDALIMGACKAGKVEGALLLLRSMVGDGFHVMHSTHTHVINGMLRLGYWDPAVRFVMACRGRDEKLDQESFGVLANKLIGLRRRDEAMLVLSEMRKMGLTMGRKLTDFYEMNVNKNQGTEGN